MVFEINIRLRLVGLCDYGLDYVRVRKMVYHVCGGNAPDCRNVQYSYLIFQSQYFDFVMFPPPWGVVANMQDV